MSNQQKYIIFDIDGCTIDDEWRLHLINPEKHDFAAYHDAMVNDKKSLPIGNLFIEYALENDIQIMFFTVAPESHRKETIGRIERIYGLFLNQFYLVMRKDNDLRPSAEIKEGMLKRNFPETFSPIIAAIDDNYDVAEMYRRNGIHSYVVSKTQLISANSPPFQDLLLNRDVYHDNFNDEIDVIGSLFSPPCIDEILARLAAIYPIKGYIKPKIIRRPENIGAAHEKFIGIDPAHPEGDKTARFIPAEEIEATQDGARGNEETGRKFDSDKLRFSLLPVDSLEEVVKVLEFGAKKYSVGNWKNVDNADQRYYDAALRHMILGSGSGELNDPETKRKHTAHAICCLLFKLHFELEADKNVKSDSND